MGMGRFQGQNYGADFVNSMATTAGMLNDRRRMDLEEKKQGQEAQTRTLQNQGLTLENQKKEADLSREKKLQSFLELSGRMQSGALAPDDYASLAGVTSELMQETPYLPNDPAEIPKYKQAVGTLLSGVQNIRSLPANNYTYTREDNVPEVNQVLDSFQTLLSKDRLGREFVDTDGSVTGKAGAAYRTGGVGGFAMQSGEGNQAAFTPLFSVVDADGRPVMNSNGRAVLVPSTQGQSNSADDKVRLITPEEMLTKAGYAYRVLDVADKLGLADPEKRKAYITNNLPALMGEDGAKKLLEKNDPPKLTTVDPTHDVYLGTKKVASGTPKVDKTVAPPQHSYKKDGYEITDRWDPATGKYIEVGRNKIREPADPGAAVGKMIQGQTLKDALDRRARALQKYNAINGANGSEYITADGVKQTIATGDLGRARDELEAANAEVANLGGKKISYTQPQEIQVDPNAKVVRQRYEQLRAEDETAAEDYLNTARSKGYSQDSIRYIKGELDNKIVRFLPPKAKGTSGQKASAPAPKPAQKGMRRTAAAPAGKASAPVTSYVYQNGKLVPRR